jgi:hypothetical protein
VCRFDATYKVDALAKLASAANRAAAGVGDLLVVFKTKIAHLMHSLEKIDYRLATFLDRLPQGSVLALVGKNSTIGKVSTSQCPAPRVINTIRAANLIMPVCFHPAITGHQCRHRGI